MHPSAQEHCEITRENSRDCELIHAISDKLKLTIIREPDQQAKSVNRNFIKKRGAESWHERCLIGELNGVKIYARVINGATHLILTTRDLYL